MCVKQWSVFIRENRLHSFLWFCFLGFFVTFFLTWREQHPQTEETSFTQATKAQLKQPCCFLEVEWSNCAKLHGGLETWMNVHCRLDSFLPKPQFHIAHCEVKNSLWCQQASPFCAKHNYRRPYKGLSHLWFPLCTPCIGHLMMYLFNNFSSL